MNKTKIATLSLLSILPISMAIAMPPSHKGDSSQYNSNGGKYSKVGSLELCVGYYKLESEEEKKAYYQELDRRAQLSSKDYDLISKNQVAPGMTMCGMYMSIGTPQAQKTRQLRPMTFKTVHVYPEIYTVTQSGMVVQTYARKEGTLPPKLAVEKPLVAPSPTLKP